MTADRAADRWGEVRPMRADARRNRESLLLAAERAFSEQGVEVSLEEVARRAGVGIGTLYRHFPARDALVEAVYRREVEIVCEAAETMLCELPPEQALVAWTDRFVRYAATRRGMSIALKSMVGAESDLFAYTQERVRGAASAILTAAADAGVIRRGVDPMDVLRLLSGICLVTGPALEEQAPRLVSLVLDGLRYGKPVQDQ
ncbi:MAG TPA: helix-turn-helix domain-containing protein [Kineosporiaceae bacterium]|nr:helix-turn-helix domain-containing protein [Kineosporiaceae bacterium]